jgi:hypothetical protein
LQAKLLDVELSIRGILRGYGLRVGDVSRGRFEARIRDRDCQEFCVKPPCWLCQECRPITASRLLKKYPVWL